MSRAPGPDDHLARYQHFNRNRLLVIPDLSVLWVIVFVLALAGVVERLLFGPVLRVIRAREAAVGSGRELAASASTQASAAAAEADEKVQGARAAVYREMDDRRRSALASHAAALAAVRSQAEAELSEATTRLRSQAEASRHDISRQADLLGAAAAERILDRKTS